MTSRMNLEMDRTRAIYLMIVLLLGLAASSALHAQNPQQIKSDPKMIWAEGSTQKEALDGITSKLAYAAGFTCPRAKFLPLMKTYSQDIRKATHQISYNGKYLRYLSGNEIQRLFQPRRQKVNELKASAQAARRRFSSSGQMQDAEDALTLCRWAIAYLSSLPGNNASELKSLQQQANSLRKAISSRPYNPSGKGMKVQMAHIDREAGQIETILGIRTTNPAAVSPPPQKAEKKEPVSQPATEAVLDSRDTSVAILPQSSLPDSTATATSEPATAVITEPATVADAETDTLTSKAPQKQPVPAARPDAPSVFSVAQIGFSPEWNAGAMLGVKFRSSAFGIYASYRSNFTSVSSDLSIDSTEDPSHLTGSHKVSLQSATAGLLFQLKETPQINLFAGAGYGSRNVCWQTTSGHWAKVTDRTSTGLALEAGLLYSPFGLHNSLCLSAGVHTIGFKTLGLTLGVGFSF